MRIGVDVGGTHTDAVLLDGKRLLASTKRPTTEDIQTGVLDGLTEVLHQSSVEPASIKMVTIGTTQFTNAVVERKAPVPVAALRIGAQSSSAMPIAAKWPEDIKAAAILSGHMIDGGSEFDGQPIKPTDFDALDALFETIAAADALAITSVFATADPSVEQDVAARMIARGCTAQISCSHVFGQLGLHQRENATILNSALLPLAEKVASAFEAAFETIGLSCPLFISQNDGTLMTAAFARQFPVLTFSSGPTNSMRGAAFLSGKANAMVVDIGGTTSDIGMLIEGFPRPSGSYVSVAGVRTNFRMPDVLAVGLGGGSLVSADGTSVGPQSLGHRLTSEGLIFGGATMTATDIAVAAGRADIGTRQHTNNIDETVRDSAMAQMRRLLEDHIDQMKTSAEPLPLVVVGGGAFLAPDELTGVSEVIRPENAGVANAIGAAFAQVGGEAEAVYTQSQKSRAEALAEAKAQALQKAVEAGALKSSTQIVTVDETPMSYVDEPGAVIRVKAIGDVDLERLNGGTA